MPELNSTVDSHFVARCFTKPWEFADRRLWVYDFEIDRIEKRSSRSLFAEEHAFPQHVETFLRDYIETPISQAREKFSSDLNVKIESWKLYRALYLQFATQPARYIQARVERAHESLETISTWDEVRVDQLVRLLEHQHQIIRMTIDTRDILHVPETGFFSVPLPVSGQGDKWEIGYAFPFDPRLMFVMCSRQVNIEATRTISFGKFSLGLNDQVRQVVISPGLKELNTDEVISVELKRLRGEAIDILRSCGLHLDENAV